MDKEVIASRAMCAISELLRQMRQEAARAADDEQHRSEECRPLEEQERDAT